jgi:hypothetical protein
MIYPLTIAAGFKLESRLKLRDKNAPHDVNFLDENVIPLYGCNVTNAGKNFSE